MKEIRIYRKRENCNQKTPPKRKLQDNIFDGCRCKNSHNISKQNPIAHKNNTLQPWWIHNQGHKDDSVYANQSM